MTWLMVVRRAIKATVSATVEMVASDTIIFGSAVDYRARKRSKPLGSAERGKAWTMKQRR